MEAYKSNPKTIEGIQSFQKEAKNTHAKLPTEKALTWFKEEIQELQEGIQKNDKENIKEELGDCLFWVASIANSLDINLSEVIEPKIRKHLQKYPEHYEQQKKDDNDE